MKKLCFFILNLVVLSFATQAQDFLLQGVLVSPTNVVLQWTSSESSTIYRKSTALNDIDFVAIANDISAGNCNYSDTLNPSCVDTLTYYIKTANNLVSNEVQIVTGDTEIPEWPGARYASIDLATQQYNLLWTPSPSPDVLGYVICKGNPCVSLDTIWDAQASVYACNSCDITEINSLAVMAFDSCMNTSLRTSTFPNMVLTVDLTNCAQPAKLSWNSFETTCNGLPSYNIYMSQNNSPFNVVATTDNTTIDIAIPASNGLTTFYVEATIANTDYVAYSNKVTKNQNTADTLDFIIMRSASVNADNKSVTVRAYVDNKKQIQDFKLYRSKDNGVFSLVATIPYTGAEIIEIQDYIGEDILSNIYSYYLEASDVCGVSYTRSSNTAKTLRVVVEEVSFSENKVMWTPSMLWQADSYDVFRYEEGDVNSATYLGSTSANVYIDDARDEMSSTDKIYYFVNATEQGFGPDNRKEEANSSHNFLKKETIFFIPNAFAPRDGNQEINTFKPACHFVKNSSYDFKIYNRWGTMLFSTNDVEEGWDGKYNGKFCKIDTYIYYIQFVNSEGKLEKHSGTFLLYD
ncbi:MAG: gliding motility-associated C-terminal domain-containing protein [Bacteroidales bacterium]|nr:gliding motility-associated C-terminal domain-containing protein [Bacteroidales bacterium]